MGEVAIPDDISALAPFLISLDRDSLKSFKQKNAANKPVAIPALDTALTKNIKALDEASLLHLCKIGLHSLFDNYGFVVICVRELIRRKHVDAQNAFVDIVIAARDEYDPGHRCFEKTVLDQLIDTLLGQFCATALIRLLHGLDYSVLSTDGADGFAELFPTAFAKLKDEPVEMLLQAIEQYVQDCRKYGDDIDSASKLLQRIVQQNHPEEITQSLKALLQQLAADKQLADLFATDDPATASELLERIGRDIPLLQAARYHVAGNLLYTHANALSFDALCEMYRRCFANQRSKRYPETDLGRLLFPLFCNHPDAAKQFALSFADECNEREFFIKCVEWSVRDGHHDEPDALQTAKDT
ncbi:MAG: hypothetical protein OEY07_11935, partial [Gammaproteobacteria bacterium]|nr:hypothetical protein [Gammaproteobacteria bacterium]